MNGRLFPLKSWASLSIPQGCRRIARVVTMTKQAPRRPVHARREHHEGSSSRPANYSLPSTAGSLKASTRSIWIRHVRSEGGEGPARWAHWCRNKDRI